MTWWQRFLKRDRLERELDSELRFHFDRLVDDNIRAGLPADEARRRARLEFGAVEPLKEDCRDARATRWAHDVVQDVRFAARLLLRERSFTVIAVLALALGMGVNSTFYAIVHSHCLRGPIRHADGLVHVGSRDAAGAPGAVSFPDFLDLQRDARTLTGLAAYGTAPVAVGDDALAPERVTAAYVSAHALATLGETPIVGRALTVDDDRPGATPVAIVSEGLWKRRYGGIPAVDRRIRLDGTPVAIVGVMRQSFRFPSDAEVWLPLQSMPGLATQPRGARRLGVIGRLASDRTLVDAQTELGAIAGRLAHEHARSNEGVRATVVPINEPFVAQLNHPAWIAFITAGTLVLLIACANVANLLLARAVRRAGELAVRTSLGASRSRIVRQLLVECALLSLLGGAGGVLLSIAGTRLLDAVIPEGATPSWMRPALDWPVLAALAAITLGAVFVFGFVPALHTSKTSVTHVVRDQGHLRASGAGARRWTTVFLTAQFALTFVLVSSVTQTLFSRSTFDPVINPTNVLTTSIALPAPKYGRPESRAQFYERLLQDAAVDGVSSTTLAATLPFAPVPQRRVSIEGRDITRMEAASTVGVVAIAPRYFETFGIGVVRGRDFTTADGMEGRDAAIVNQRFAELYFSGEDPIGRRIRMAPPNTAADDSPWVIIVGVAPTIRQGRDAAPLVYEPFRASLPPAAALVLRGRTDLADRAVALRERVRALDPDLPLYRTMTMERVMSDARWNPRVASAIINIISTIALLLAVVGLYGVTAHSVAARAREIGIRVAVGARPRHVRWVVLRRALFQLAFGVPAGIALTIVWNRMFIVESATDLVENALVLATAAVVIVVIGITACLIPARQAVRLDPMTTLRT